MTVWEGHPDARLTELLSEEPQPVQLHGFIVDDPVEPLEPGEAESGSEQPRRRDADRQTAVLALRHWRTAHGWCPIDGRVRATIMSPRALVRYGDEVLVEGEWSRVPAPGNPGQYDWRAALARKRIHGLLRVRPFDGLVVLRHGQGNPVLAAVFRLRHRWEQLIRAHFSARDAGLLLGLLLGQRAEIDEDLKEAFTTTGTIHLLVISGSNVGLIAVLLGGLLRLLGVSRPWALGGLAVGVGIYCLLTGAAPPVTRAMVMAWMLLGAHALDRVISWPNTLAAAALVLLWANPTQLVDPSCQLSFGAVASLLALTGRWFPWLEAMFAWVRPSWIRVYLAMSLAATGAIWVGLAPVLAWYFHLVSPVSMLANVLLVPLMSGLVTVGTSVLTPGTIYEPIVGWGTPLLRGMLQATIGCVSWCHAIPGGFWYVGQPSLWWMGGYYGLLALSMWWTRHGARTARLVILWTAAATVWLWSLVAARALSSRWLRVDVLDVGHGDCLLVRAPRGPTWLIDAGSRDAGSARVVPLLRAEGISTVDALLLTHPDEDHVGGARVVLSTMRVRQLLTNGARDARMSAREIGRQIRAQRIPAAVVTAGMTWQAKDGLRVDVLHPPQGFVPGTSPGSNENSVVLKLTKGSVSLLLTGDLEEAGLPWILRAGEALRSTVLKVPHHGSRLGEAGAAFFRAVQPRIALLSVGRAHQLPAPETIRAVETTGALLLSTRDDGAISLRTDGRRVQVRAWKHSRRWQPINIDSQTLRADAGDLHRAPRPHEDQ